MTLPRTLAAAMCALSLAPAAQAAILIEHPWSRPTPPSAPTAVGYLTIVNTGAAPDRLLAVQSPAAAEVAVHSMTMTGGIMRMRPVEGGLPAPAHGKTTLGPDGDHLMFVRLKRPFRAGERIPVTLVFERAGRVGTALVVEGSGDEGKPATAMHGMDMPRR